MTQLTVHLTIRHDRETDEYVVTARAGARGAVLAQYFGASLADALATRDAMGRELTAGTGRAVSYHGIGSALGPDFQVR